MPKLSGKYLHFKLFIKTIFGDFWGFSILNGCSLKKNISAPSFRRKYFSSFFLLLKVEEKLLDRKIGFGAKIIFYSNLKTKRTVGTSPLDLLPHTPFANQVPP